MSELSNEPSLSLEPMEDEKAAPRGPMIVTMLLLIAGLLMAGAMFLNYGMKAANAGDDAPGFNLAALKAKTAAFARGSDTADSAAPEDGSAAPGSRFFGNRLEKGRWPKLELTSFGSSSAGESDFAIINGKLVRPGQLIADKVMLVGIEDHGAIVEYMGETRTLYIDLKTK
ncbi:hypothetical protein [Pontiella sp.]|uniref:hypothetical protein n=1 Tax=Pontiella sp. TaxID=2837462 RepID=UPI00356401D7